MVEAPDVPGDLVVRARKGHREALRTLLDRLARYTFNLAYRISWNATDAEDLSQEIFVRLHRVLDRYDPSLPFLPWFRTLATNVCLNHIKRGRATRAASIDAMEGMDVPAASEEGGNPEFAEKLRKAVAELPDEYRMVVTWLYFEELSVAEISEAMKVPTGTVKTWLFRARDQLREKLKPFAALLR